MPPAPGVPRHKWRSNRDGSQAAIWRAIRDYGARSFTVAEVAESADRPHGTAQSYIRALARGGILAVVESSRNTQAGATPALYRAAKPLGPLAPVVHGEGAERVASDPNELDWMPPTRHDSR